MVRKFVTATVSAALCLSAMTPAFAQDYRFAGFDAPRGATATANLRVPLGRENRVAKPTYGLTFGYGKTLGTSALNGSTTSRAMNVADFRFSGSTPKLQRANLASFDLANLDKDRRLNMIGGGGATSWIIIGVAAGAAACFLVFDCFEGDDNDADNN